LYVDVDDGSRLGTRRVKSKKVALQDAMPHLAC
jgi:hypothetical protein